MTPQLLAVSRDQAQGNTEISAPIEDIQPWQRQKNEPARWFLRFQIYKGMGAKRSLRAAIEAENDQDQATTGNKEQREKIKKGNLSSVSVPGAWSRASKLWQWQDRAAAYDLDRQKGRAALFQKTFLGASEYASAAYRIFELNTMVDILDQYITSNVNKQPNFVLKCMRQQQALLKDIRDEMRAYPGLDLAMLDAQIADSLHEKEEQKLAHKMKATK